MNTVMTFTFFSIILIGLGFFLLITSGTVWEQVLQYDQKCYPKTDSGGKAVWEKDLFTFPFGSIVDDNKKMCEDDSLVIQVEEDRTDTVFVYYELDNFFQNHRRYVKSRDNNQLAGTYKDVEALGKCRPVKKNGDLWNN